MSAAFWWFVIGLSLGTLGGAALGYYSALADRKTQKLNRRLNSLEPQGR